jgi:GMP synthase PP-ATPase subunit
MAKEIRAAKLNAEKFVSEKVGEIRKIAGKIIKEVPGVVRLTCNITPKPPSTIEAV